MNDEPTESWITFLDPLTVVLFWIGVAIASPILTTCAVAIVACALVVLLVVAGLALLFLVPLSLGLLAFALFLEKVL